MKNFFEKHKKLSIIAIIIFLLIIIIAGTSDGRKGFKEGFENGIKSETKK